MMPVKVDSDIIQWEKLKSGGLAAPIVLAIGKCFAGNKFWKLALDFVPNEI